MHRDVDETVARQASPCYGESPIEKKETAAIHGNVKITERHIPNEQDTGSDQQNVSSTGKVSR
jgi:hypothetical protein